jgi:hypothetical protein
MLILISNSLEFSFPLRKGFLSPAMSSIVNIESSTTATFTSNRNNGTCCYPVDILHSAFTLPLLLSRLPLSKGDTFRLLPFSPTPASYQSCLNLFIPPRSRTWIYHRRWTRFKSTLCWRFERICRLKRSKSRKMNKRWIPWR